MKLEFVTHGPNIDNPSDTDIAAAIPDQYRGEEGIILRSDTDGQVFMQTVGNIIEYREKDPATGAYRQFRGVGDQPTERIIELFCVYNRGDQSFKTAIEWEDISDELKRSDRNKWIIGAVFAVIVAAIVVLKALHKW
jgi:hypothetical protein